MFDLTKNYETPFEPLLEGYYPCIVDSCEWKISQTGSEYLSLELNVKNRKVYHNLNLLHIKEQVRNIALADLKNLVIACGFDVAGLGSVDKDALINMLIGAACEVKLAIQPEKDGYAAKNTVKGWRKLIQKQNDKLPF